MYEVRTGEKGSIKQHFYNGVHEFIRFAKSNNRNNTEIRCPCSKCQHLKQWKPDIVEVHLYQYGFVPDYYFWDRHGELIVPNPVHLEEEVDTEIVPTNLIEDMVEDAARLIFSTIEVDGNASKRNQVLELK